MIKAVFFDLDGTLLPFNENEFVKVYFGLLAKKLNPLGYEKDRLVDCLWTGTKKMMMNDGSKTNEEVFWDYFAEVYGQEKLEDKEFINSFYTNEFKQVKSICKENPYVRDIIDYCKKNNLLVVLATNPIFPKAGTLTRMSFIGLKDEDFDFVTVYENSKLAKPNPKYYQWLLDKFNLQGEEVLMFGNNEYEDGIAQTLGMKTYLVGDYIIENNKLELDLERIQLSEIKNKITENIK